LLLLISVMSLAVMPYTVLMPVFATKILHGGPSTLGFLMTASGTGALVSALFLASRASILGLGMVIVRGTLFCGIGLIAFALSRELWLSLAMMFATGFGMMTQMAASNTILQTIVEDDKRGRVMSLNTMAFMGVAPLGSLLAGGLAGWIGAPNTLVIGGICCLLTALAFAARLPALREQVRPIYVQAGILPEAAVPAAAEAGAPTERT
jgi:MFS family permease